MSQTRKMIIIIIKQITEMIKAHAQRLQGFATYKMKHTLYSSLHEVYTDVISVQVYDSRLKRPELNWVQ